MIGNKCAFINIAKSSGNHTYLEPGEHESTGPIMVRVDPRLEMVKPLLLSIDGHGRGGLSICKRCGCAFWVGDNT